MTMAGSQPTSPKASVPTSPPAAPRSPPAASASATVASPAAAASSPAAAVVAPSAIAPSGDDIIAAGDITEDYPRDSDGDSTYSDRSLSTGSLSESIFNYRVLHGRTFNNSSKAAEYWAPNDAQHNEGLELMYNGLVMAMGGKIFYAPIGESEADQMRVLDIGTGTGVWAIDFADSFPGSTVIGTDVSPIQPSWVPPNVQFQIDDFLLDWTWPENHFDFVHSRMLYGAVPDYVDLFRKSYQHLQPGGWYEGLEMDVNIQSDHVQFPPGHIFQEWANLFYKVGDITAKPFTVGKSHEMRDAMIEVGFVDVVETKIKVPIGGWPKDPNLQQAGLLCLSCLDNSLEGYALWGFVTHLGWSAEEVMAYTAKYRAEMKKRANCGYLLTTVIYGRKPEDA